MTTPTPPSAPPAPHALLVTSDGAEPTAVVPVLAAVEALGVRVRALDVGAAGGGGAGVADRVRRALLGESAERRLRRELEANPPDVALAFDPHATLALGVARDALAAPCVVVAVVPELTPHPAWGQAGADRYCVVDADAAIALAEHGVEEDRVLVVGGFGPRAWSEAGAQDRAAVRARFKLDGPVALVEVAGMGGEATASLAVQLSLSDLSDRATFLFDAGEDVEAAAALRAKVPALGLRAKLFGRTADAALLWRCAEVVVARPTPGAVSRAALIGAPVVALVDGAAASSAAATATVAALEARGKGRAVNSPLLVSAAVEACLAEAKVPRPAADGAGTVADVAWVLARDRRAVVEEVRAAVRAAAADAAADAAAASAASARVAAAPGDLEDLGGPSGPPPRTSGPPPGAGAPRPEPSADDLLDQLKRRAGVDPAAAQPAGGRTEPRRAGPPDLDDELAALKRRMSQTRKP